MGTRMGAYKPLLNIEGRPLVYFPASVLHTLSVSEFCAVVPSRYSSEVEAVLKSIAGRGSVHIALNDEPWRENGYSLILAVKECPWSVDEATLVTMSDHIYSPTIPARLAAARAKGTYLIGGDREPAYIDVEEATKLKADGAGLISEVGKGLEAWSHVDVGVHLADLRILSNLAERSYERISLNQLNSLVAAEGALAVADVTGALWCEVDSREDLDKLLKGERRVVLEHVLEWLRR
jgi:1L-myo-inositol 1-phosphate cytidylyltransferase